MMAVGLGLLSFQSQIPVPQDWVRNIKTVSNASYTSPYAADDTIVFSAVFLGMFAGNICLIHFMKYNPSTGTIRQKIGRVFLGFLGLLVIVYGPNLIIPPGSDLPGQLLRFSKFGLASFWMSLLAPILFKRWSLL